MLGRTVVSYSHSDQTHELNTMLKVAPDTLAVPQSFETFLKSMRSNFTSVITGSNTLPNRWVDFFFLLQILQTGLGFRFLPLVDLLPLETR
jgi:hypothetical protein